MRLVKLSLLLAVVSCTADYAGHRPREPMTTSPAVTRMDDAAEADIAMEPPAPSSSSAPPPTKMPPPMGQKPVEWNTERYRSIEEARFKDAKASPLSTFSIDVDTAAYSLVRRFLELGEMPPEGAVRIEEMLNYFDYAYSGPKDAAPFAIHTAVAAAPWQPEHRIVRIAIKGKEIPIKEAPQANLIFLIDVSGSMEPADRLPLLKRSLALLVPKLRAHDTVGIVVYAGASGVVLEPTSDQEKIVAALDRLNAGGSTNGGAGIELAYKLAKENFTKDGVNRVILATDGDFNVGVTSESALVKLVEKKAQDGIFLSVLGFGNGNYNDSMMEQIADRGNGNYAYVDGDGEAKKVLVDQLSGTLVTIAKDVKIQVEFNPAQVESYRLIGYENRALANEDFNDDQKDAGEIGAGHSVTALYEVVPKGAKGKASVDPLRYQKAQPAAKAATDELLTVKVRYKTPEGTKSQLLIEHVAGDATALDQADPDFRFAVAVAGFGMKLRGSPSARAFAWDDILALAKSGLGEDARELRSGFLSLVRKADRLSGH